MSLYINRDVGHRLAQELDEKIMATKATKASRKHHRYVRPLKASDNYGRLLAIGKSCAVHLNQLFDSIDHGQLFQVGFELPK